MLDVEFEKTSIGRVQESRIRQMWASVVLAVLDDFIKDNKTYANTRGEGFGTMHCRLWANSADGREVLMSAGIAPGERTANGLAEFVDRGVRTSIALSSEYDAQRVKEAV